METFEIIAESRQNIGKRSSRRLRNQGKVPGIVYGKGQSAVPIMIDHNEILHHLEHEAFHSHVLTLKMGDTEDKVVLKALQHHPYRPAILHLDLQRIDEKQQLTIRVPLHFINESACVGVKQDGGVISHLMTDLEINCLPKNLPEYIEIDMLNIGIGGGIHLGEINVPEGTEITALMHGGDPKQIVASVHMPKVVQEEVVVVEETADDIEAEEEDDSKTAD